MTVCSAVAGGTLTPGGNCGTGCCCDGGATIVPFDTADTDVGACPIGNCAGAGGAWPMGATPSAGDGGCSAGGSTAAAGAGAADDGSDGGI